MPETSHTSSLWSGDLQAVLHELKTMPHITFPNESYLPSAGDHIVFLDSWHEHPYLAEARPEPDMEEWSVRLWFLDSYEIDGVPLVLHVRYAVDKGEPDATFLTDKTIPIWGVDTRTKTGNPALITAMRLTSTSHDLAMLHIVEETVLEEA